jgi:hypothetical protein
MPTVSRLAAAFVSGAEPDNKLLQQAILNLQPSTAPVASTSTLLERIDHFYQDRPENMSLPIVAAMNHVKAVAKKP